MNCPQCQVPMHRGLKFWMCEECGHRVPRTASPAPPDLPNLLAIPLHEVFATPLPELRLHRLCDAVEILTRFCTILALAEVRLPDEQSRLPGPLARQLGPDLKTPTFARWLGMAKALGDCLAADRSAPLVLPELPRFIREVLLPMAPPGNRFLEASILELRNTLAHGGTMTRAMAEYLLQGDATGQGPRLTSETPTTFDTDEIDEDASPAVPIEPGSVEDFPGWEVRLHRAVEALASMLVGSRLCSFDGQEAWDLTGREPSGVMTLSADLRVTLRRLNLQGHVLLVRDGRWLDLWPLCDYGRARLMALRGLVEAEQPSPLLYYRAEDKRLLYAAFGTNPPVSERCDIVAEFQALFQTEQRREPTPEAALDFTDELRSDAAQMIGRAAEYERIRKVVDETASGVLWLSGTGGVGKSFLPARVAVKRNTDPRRWCCIAWRFRVSDADRSNRNTFLRYAITRLAAWKPLGRADVRPDMDSNKLPAQFDELLREAEQLQPVGKAVRPPRVLFVLDGMDEAARLSPELLEWPFRFRYANVVWLCAGRAEGTDRAFASKSCMHLFWSGLPPMGGDDIRAMLYEQLGEQKYELLGLDRRDDLGKVTNPLVEAIVEKSEGLPLYVRFLVEDLRTQQFELTVKQMSKLPQGLTAYYEGLLDRVSVDDVQALLPKLLGVIVWAQGPVAGELLFEILRRMENVPAEEEERLRADIQEGLNRVASMIRPASLPEGGLGWEPYHTTFRDHFRASKQRLERTNNRAREAFVRLTIDWRNVKGAEGRPIHLPPWTAAPAGRESPRGSGCARARRGVSRRTGGGAAGRARGAAADVGGGVGRRRTARRCGGHGRVSAAARGANACSAERIAPDCTATRQPGAGVRLADLADAERAVMYRLLLTWELCDSGRITEAGRVLEELARRNLPRLNGNFASVTIPILAQLVCFLPATVTEFASRLFERDAESRDQSLADIAAAQAQAGQVEAALQIVRIINDPHDQAWAFQAVATAQAQASQMEAALHTVRAIVRPDNRAGALAAVAVIQARTGQVEAARLTFDQALQIALTTKESYHRAWALRTIAGAQAQAGQVEAARQTACIIDDDEPPFQAEALQAIATAQAQGGQLEAALQTAHAIGDRVAYAAALESIAAAQARTGQVEAALQIACAIDDPYRRPEVFGAIAVAQAQAGQEEAAHLTFEQALQNARTSDLTPAEWLNALQTIAAAQVQAGLVEAAFQTARACGGQDDRAQVVQAIASAQVRAGQTDGTPELRAGSPDRAAPSTLVRCGQQPWRPSRRPRQSRAKWKPPSRPHAPSTDANKPGPCKALRRRRRGQARWRQRCRPFAPSAIPTTNSRP